MAKTGTYKNFFRGAQCAGVHLCMMPDGTASYTLVMLRKKASQVIIAKREKDIDDFDALLHHLPKGVPIVLAIEGKGIVSRKLNTENLTTEAEIVSRVLPNAKPVDFYIQKSIIRENEIFLTLARKTAVDEILSRFDKEKRFVINVYFGPFSINHVASLLDEKYDTINGKLGGYRMESGVIREMDVKSPEPIGPYRLGNELLSDQDIVPFSAAFSFFVSTADIQSEIPVVESRQEEFLYKRMFNIIGATLLLLVFIVLMGNLVLYQKYSKESAALVEQLAINEDLIYELETVEGILKSKEEFISRSGFLQSSRLSYYADRLAMTVPGSIRLTKCDLEPLEKKLKNNEQPIFSNNKVRVSGFTGESTVLNNWMKKISSEQWVRDVRMIDYKQDKSSDPGEFEIEIIIK